MSSDQSHKGGHIWPVQHLSCPGSFSSALVVLEAVLHKQTCVNPVNPKHLKCLQASQMSPSISDVPKHLRCPQVSQMSAMQIVYEVLVTVLKTLSAAAAVAAAVQNH